VGGRIEPCLVGLPPPPWSRHKTPYPNLQNYFAMGKLVTLVSRSPSLLLGHSVARLPKLRVGASQEAWLITAVRLAKGGGNPKVYGMRYSLGANKGLEFLDTKGREIHGPLKGDWTGLFSPPGGVLSEGSVVRSPVALCLSPELEGKAVRLEAPYDTLKDSLLARASKERELHMRAVLARAAGAPLEAGADPAAAGGAEEGAAVQGGDAAGSPAAAEAPPAEAAAAHHATARANVTQTHSSHQRLGNRLASVSGRVLSRTTCGTGATCSRCHTPQGTTAGGTPAPAIGSLLPVRASALLPQALSHLLQSREACAALTLDNRGIWRLLAKIFGWDAEGFALEWVYGSIGPCATHLA
jgi:hypothetical protein